MARGWIILSNGLVQVGRSKLDPELQGSLRIPGPGEADGMNQDAPISAGKPAAPVGSPGVPEAPCHLVGRSTHQSSSTTRTSTKNVFLLTRFLKVSAKGENFSYVKCRLGKAILM